MPFSIHALDNSGSGVLRKITRYLFVLRFCIHVICIYASFILPLQTNRVRITRLVKSQSRIVDPSRVTAVPTVAATSWDFERWRGGDRDSTFTGYAVDARLVRKHGSRFSYAYITCIQNNKCSC